MQLSLHFFDLSLMQENTKPKMLLEVLTPGPEPTVFTGEAPARERTLDALNSPA
jgi:hypothetical protein